MDERIELTGSAPAATVTFRPPSPRCGSVEWFRSGVLDHPLG